ncbi:unnamed protein product [Coccothraustes coccothraustes]
MAAAAAAAAAAGARRRRSARSPAARPRRRRSPRPLTARLPRPRCASAVNPSQNERARSSAVSVPESAARGACKAPLQHSLTLALAEASVSKVPSRSDSGMAGRVLSLFKGLRGKKRNGPAAATVQQPAEPEQFQPLRDDAAKEHAQEQDRPRGRFRRAAQTLWRFLRLRRRKTSGPTTEGMAEPDSRPSEPQEDDASSVTSSDFTTVSEEETAEGWAEADMGLAEGMATTNTHLEGIPETEAMPMLNVLATVSNILQRLTTCTTVDAGLQMDILSLTEEHPAHVVLSLLRCVPTCDGCMGHGTDAQLCSHRAAALMWRAIGTSEVATEEVLPALLSAIEEQPAYGGFFCSGDNKAVFARAATLALWRMAPMSEWHYAMLLHSPQLFVALLLQIVTSTEQTPEDVETQSFWRACQEEHGLPSEPNRFAVQTMKALLSSLGLDKKLVALEHTRVWEKLLCANTQHYAAGLLAREMRRGLTSLCPHMASHLLSLLIGKQARWHLPALAFFVEAGGIRGLYQRLVEQLADADAEMVRMTLSRLTDMLQDKGLKPPSLTLLKLAESLLPLVENDNSHVRLLSIQLFCQVMELVVEEGDDPLTTIREDESPSSISVLIQLAFERRSAGLRSSAESDVPESMGDFQLPLKMGAPAEQDAPAGAPGPALAAQS